MSEFVTLRIPDDLAEDLTKCLEEYGSTWENRSQFVRAAIREKIHRLNASSLAEQNLDFA